MSRFQEERKGWVCMHHVRRHAYSVGQSYTEKNPSLSPSSYPPPLLHPDLHIFQDVNGLSMADVDSSHLCRPRGPVNRRKTSHLQHPSQLCLLQEGDAGELAPARTKTALVNYSHPEVARGGSGFLETSVSPALPLGIWRGEKSSWWLKLTHRTKFTLLVA